MPQEPVMLDESAPSVAWLAARWLYSIRSRYRINRFLFPAGLLILLLIAEIEPEALPFGACLV